jgi:hypothetical protein
LLKTLKNKKKNKFIVSERQYIGITATINGFRSTLASCEGVHGVPDGDATRLDTVGQELVELTVQIRCGNPRQGPEELCPDCHLQQGKVRGHARRHT